MIKKFFWATFIFTLWAVGHSAAQEIDSIKNLLITTPSGTTHVELYRELSFIFENQNIDSAHLYAEKSLALAESLSYDIGRAKATEQMAWVESYQGNGEKSIALILQSKEIAEESNDKLLMSKVLNSAGELHNRQNAAEEALIFFRSALQLQKEIGDTITQVSTLSNLSILFGKAGDFDNSEDHILEAYGLAQALNDDRLITLTSNNLARLYLYSKNYEESRKYSKIGAQYAIKTGNRRVEAYALNNIGMTHEFQGNTSKALEYYKKSLAVHKYLKDPLPVMDVLRTIGKFFAQLREYDSAEFYYERGMEIAQETNNLVSQSKLHAALYSLDTIRNNYASALFHINEYIRVNDSISTNENKQAIQDLKVAYDTERKEDKIELLKSQNEIESIKSARQRNLKMAFIIGSILLALLCLLIYSRFVIKKRSLKIIEIQKDAIEEKNQENVLLMKETHHRVKNNLQLILSLLSAQKNILLEDDKALGIIQESQNRIKSISLLHESLYDNKNYDTVNATEYFKEIVSNIHSSFVDNTKNIGVEAEIEDATIDTSLAVALGLIINELVTNSLKYAFHNKSQGSLTIKFQKSTSDSKLRLKIADDGCGLPEGFDIEKSTSFGLQMVKGLVNQLGGMLVLKTDNGTGYDISVSDAKIE